jgi:lysophospholipase L1-like esterase
MMVRNMIISRFALAAVLVLLPGAGFAQASLPDHWVGTWATANYMLDNTRAKDPATAFGAADMTYREIVHTTLAGPLVRVELSNEFGTEPLKIGEVHLAMASAHGSIELTTAHEMTFNGLPSIIIPPGAIAVSDTAAADIPAGVDLAVSIFIPAQTISHVSFHNAAYTTNYKAPGDVVGKDSLPSPQTGTSWYFLRAVDVKATEPTAAAVVAFGDSITDGTGSTTDANNTWPDLLAERLRHQKKTRDLAVLNEGIGGNRILHDGTGPSALARFDDALTLPGVRYVVILEGINDIGHAYDPKRTYDVVTAADLEQGFVQLIERAHDHGIKVYGATLTPYMGAGYSSPAGEVVREELNTWIRTTNKLDGFIDFDAATRDKANPQTFRQDFQRGDQLHPNPAGYRAMADSINLKLFELDKKEKYDIKHEK